MKYFTQDYLDFFKELAANNNKDWFQENKKRYEQSVKKPFYKFLGDLIAEINKQETILDVEPKDCVLRINRDIRFSKDKTPYNTHFTAFVSKGGRKNKNIPGIFLRFSPEMIGIMGGCYMPDKEQLAAIRDEISNDITKFKEIISNKEFTSKFGAIRGEQHKRVAKELQEIAEKEPLILNKQFYFMAQLEPELLLSENLLTIIMEHWYAMKPVNDYLENCLN